MDTVLRVPAVPPEGWVLDLLSVRDLQDRLVTPPARPHIPKCLHINLPVPFPSEERVRLELVAAVGTAISLLYRALNRLQ